MQVQNRAALRALFHDQGLLVNKVDFLGRDSAGDEVEFGAVHLHGGGELVAHFSRNLAFADELVEHRGEIGGAFEAQQCQDALDIFGDLLFADFCVGGKEEPLDAPVNVDPQTLTAPDRVGFSLVEWGGARVENAE